MSLDQIKTIIKENRKAGRHAYKGLDSADIGTYNRSLMWGDDDEAYPGDEEWSEWVD